MAESASLQENKCDENNVMSVRSARKGAAPLHAKRVQLMLSRVRGMLCTTRHLPVCMSRPIRETE